MLKIILLIILISQSFSSNNDFCFKNEIKTCNESYDRSSLRYMENCVKIGCKSPFSFDYNEYCTKSSAVCKYFNLYLRVLKLKEQKDSILNCTLISKPKPSEFCLNGKYCLQNLITKFGNFTSRIACLSPANRNFECGKYCTSDSIICDAMKKSKIIRFNRDSCITQKNRDFLLQ